MSPNLFVYKIQLNRPEILTDGPTPEEKEIMARHADHLQQLTEQGVALLAGRTLNTDPSCFGIVLFQAASPEQAMEIMQSDPGVQQGLWRAELYPFRVAFLNATFNQFL
jgi:uncharacterized protein YciI